MQQKLQQSKTKITLKQELFLKCNELNCIRFPL